MGATISSDATWSLGSVVGTRVSDGQVLELCGASNQIEAAYKRWLEKASTPPTDPSVAATPTTATATASTLPATGDGSSNAAATPSVVDPDATLTIDLTIGAAAVTAGFDASDDNSSTNNGDAATVTPTAAAPVVVPAWLRARIVIEFPTMTGHLVLPMPFTTSEAQQRKLTDPLLNDDSSSNSGNHGASTNSNTSTATVAVSGQPDPAAPATTAPAPLISMGAQPARRLLRNGLTPALPTDSDGSGSGGATTASIAAAANAAVSAAALSAGYRHPMWVWWGGGRFRRYIPAQRTRLEGLYQSYRTAKAAFNLAQVDPAVSQDQLRGLLARYNLCREVTVVMNKGKYSFNFETMEQRSRKTGRARSIRRTGGSGGGGVPADGGASANNTNNMTAASSGARRGRGDLQPRSPHESEGARMLVVFACPTHGTVPLWKWERQPGLFEPYSLALCAQIERLYKAVLEVEARHKEAWTDAELERVKAAGTAAAPQEPFVMDPHQQRRTLMMFTRPNARNRVRFIFSFEHPARFLQLNGTSGRGRRIVRTPVPRTAFMEIVALEVQKATEEAAAEAAAVVAAMGNNSNTAVGPASTTTTTATVADMAAASRNSVGLHPHVTGRRRRHHHRRLLRLHQRHLHSTGGRPPRARRHRVAGRRD